MAPKKKGSCKPLVMEDVEHIKSELRLVKEKLWEKLRRVKEKLWEKLKRVKEKLWETLRRVRRSHMLTGFFRISCRLAEGFRSRCRRSSEAVFH